MKIAPPDRTEKRAVELNAEIEAAAGAKRIPGRVCGAVCDKPCPSCGSVACQCMCAPDCADAPRALSSDPDNYPVEPGIAPLVFEMRRHGLFRPCWSCEGHAGHDGRPWKLPRVWFYCDSPVHARLLSDALVEMEGKGRLKAQWRVALTHSDADNPETTFSLEPPDSARTEHRLADLQADARAIATALADMVGDQAERLRRGTAAAPGKAR